MKPVISNRDYKELIKTVLSQSFPEKNFFKNLLNKFKTVPDNEVPQGTVKLNSLVRFWHSLLKKVVTIRIVLPGEANLKDRKISVFSPLSLALIGRSVNENVTIQDAFIQKNFRILKVTN